MPRPKKVGGPEPKRRSRNGCWPCKARKVKCGEEKPSCLNCQRQGETCDYSIRLNWEGRSKKKNDNSSTISFSDNDSTISTPPDSATLPPPQGMPFYTSSPIDPQQYNQETLNPVYHSGLPRSQLPPPQMPRSTFTAPDLSGTWFSMGNTVGQNGSDPRFRAQSMGQYDLSSGMVPGPPFRVIPYPSPAESGLGSPGAGNIVPAFSSMLPPYALTSQPSQSVGSHNGDPTYNDRAKRLRLSPKFESATLLPRNRFNRSNSYGPGELDDHPRAFQPLTPTFGYSPHIVNPLTPGASSTMSNEPHDKWVTKPTPPVTKEEEPERRVSVNSLLSGPPGDGDQETPPASAQPPPAPTPSMSCHWDSPTHQRSDSSATDTYGLDRGLPDLDLPQNNDLAAITNSSPYEMNWDIQSGSFDMNSPEFGFGVPKKETVFAKGGYYASPVPIKIPRSLEPLPMTLLQNPMNLLYFHHFLNHTARILVPHDCSANPFKTILPQMAVENSNLLNLLLAYSASHRARLLNQPEPANRIALWVRDVFPTLRFALESSSEKLSNANLATAIMLASLEIISPNTFEVAIPWQQHLNIARRIIAERGGLQHLTRRDKTAYFLSRWFAYLDILGSLSAPKSSEHLFTSSTYWSSSGIVDSPSASSTSTGTMDDSGEDDFQIDCLLGFTSRCVTILAQIAGLARHCDNERLRHSGEPVPGWAPSAYIASRAESLRVALNDARTHAYKPCPYRDSNPDSPQEAWDGLEMAATNEAFHWAGLVHLYRRVLGKTREDQDVQNAVGAIVASLYKIRRGGQAEACLLFPMFTAGCDALDPLQREMIMERVRSVEGFGMTQVHKARALMQQVWETGKPWEMLVQGEFFG